MRLIRFLFRRRTHAFAWLLALLLLSAPAGALDLGSGFGTETRGGLGGRVIKVTTLADDGPGSLRAALRAKGPRVIVFEVGGVIELEKDLKIPEPYVTIAGQTAPSPGITLIRGGLRIGAHDVVVQHLRIRVGAGPAGTRPDDRDGIAIIGKRDGSRSVYNVVIDNCSISWAIDEGISTFFPPIHDVTVRDSIIAEMLTNGGHPKGEHAYGFLIGKGTQRISVIGNLFAHNTRRNPVGASGTSSVVVNNLVYNPGANAIHFYGGEPVLASVVGNVVIRGPDSKRHDAIHFQRRFHPESRIYLDGNIGPLGTHPVVIVRSDDPGGAMKPLVPVPPLWPEGLRPLPARDLEKEILSRVGARPKDRDATDRRIVGHVVERTGKLIGTQDEVGGFPQPEPTRRRLDPPSDPGAVGAWLDRFTASVE